MKKRIPKFKNEDEEREFWATHDSTDYIDWSKGKKVVLSKLKPSIKTFSLRLPESMLEELQLLATNQRAKNPKIIISTSESLSISPLTLCKKLK